MMMKKKIPIKRNATIKQKRLIKSILENVGKKGKPKPMKQLVKDAGYTDAMAKNPKQIISSPTFQDLLERSGVTDLLLTKVLKDGLTHPGKGNGAALVRHHYLGTGLKLKKHLSPMGEEIVDAFKQLVQIGLPAHEPLPKK